MSSLMNRFFIISLLFIASIAQADIKSDIASAVPLKTVIANAVKAEQAPDQIVKALIANKVDPAVATAAVIEAFPSYIHVTSITRAAISAAPFSSAPSIVSAAVKAASEFEDDITKVAVGSVPAQKEAIKAEANKAAKPFVNLTKISELAKKEPPKTERQLQENASVGLAGVVLATKGKVIAVGPKGESRVLIRRSNFFAKDVIRTGPESSVQLRFEDNAIMGLNENSELKIKDYHYGGQKDAKNQVAMELISGGFRTISGSIGKANKAAYSIATPAATIGIRGTDYQVVITIGGKFIAMALDGTITISNSFGTLNIGAGSPYIFASFEKEQTPTGTKVFPKEFISFNAVNSATSMSTEQKEALIEILGDEQVQGELEEFLLAEEPELTEEDIATTLDEYLDEVEELELTTDPVPIIESTN